MNINMNITFWNKKEIFNNKCYPLGTIFTFFVNQLSSFAYNKNFKLESYKNVDLLKTFFNTAQNIENKRLQYIYNLIPNQFENFDFTGSSTYPGIEIAGIDITENEFEKITLFISYIDLFFDIALENDYFMNLTSFLGFFNIINNYTIPNLKVLPIDNFRHLIDSDFKAASTPVFNKDYTEIIESDRNALKLLLVKNKLVYQYQCNDFVDVLLSSLHYILEHGFHLKRCAFCNNFFIAVNKKRRFCNNIRPQYISEPDSDYLKKKYSCYEYNNKILAFKTSDEVAKAIRKVTLRIQKRIRNNTETQAYLDSWREKVTQKKYEVMSYHYITKDKFIKWILNESDSHGRKSKDKGEP